VRHERQLTFFSPALLPYVCITQTRNDCYSDTSTDFEIKTNGMASGPKIAPIMPQNRALAPRYFAM
jgi:hypothetical protein